MPKRVALFACMECGRNFYSTATARRAANNGCPGCGGVDIDVFVVGPEGRVPPEAMPTPSDLKEDGTGGPR